MPRNFRATFDSLWYAAFPYVLVPKTAKIYNSRLAFAYFLMIIATLAFVVVMLSRPSNYLKLEEPDGSVARWIEVSGEEYERQVEADFQKEPCTDSSRYDYWYSSSWVYTENKCTDLPSYERSTKGSDGSLYIPVAFEETRERIRALPSDANASDPDVCAGLTETCAGGWKPRPIRSVPGTPWTCRCDEVARYFVVGLEAFNIGIEHYYEMVRDVTNELHSRQHSGRPCDESGWKCESDQAQLKTIVVLSKDGKEIVVPGASFVSPEPITLHIATLVKTAGLSFDSLNEDTLANMLHCDHPDAPDECRDDLFAYPTLRQTGMEMRLSMKYFNNYFKPDYPELRSHSGPTCVITVVIISKWSSKPTLHCGEPRQIATANVDCTGRYNYGIAISIESSGTFAFVDWVKIVVAFGAAISYFSLPFMIIQVVALYLCGPLSEFYSHQCQPDCRVDDAVVSCMTQAMAATSSYRTLTAGSHKLTKSLVFAEIHAALDGSSELGVEEQATLAELVWDRLAAKNPESSGTSASSVANSSDKAAIAMPQFVTSTTGTAISKSVIKLFSKRRIWNPLEYLFTPRSQTRKAQHFERAASGDFDRSQLMSYVSSHTRHLFSTEVSVKPWDETSIPRENEQGGLPLRRETVLDPRVPYVPENGRASPTLSGSLQHAEGDVPVEDSMHL